MVAKQSQKTGKLIRELRADLNHTDVEVENSIAHAWKGAMAA
jgi:uncharacterized protein YwbE